MTESQRQDAEYLWRALMVGAVERRDVVNWADSVILADPHPDAVLLDISQSSARPLVDLVSLLRRVPGQFQPLMSVQRLSRRLLTRLSEDSNRGPEIASSLYVLACAGGLPDEVAHQASSLDDGYHLARSGVYGTIDDATATLRSCLEAWASTIDPPSTFDAGGHDA